MRLSRESALELREFFGSVKVFLARYADSDPEAKRLYRELSAAGESGGTSERMIYLSADDSGGTPLKKDLAGHVLADYDGVPRHCLKCSTILLAAGDISVGHESEFAPSALHDAIQRYILAHPGTEYLQALELVSGGAA
jgi:hypothetical protein